MGLIIAPVGEAVRGLAHLRRSTNRAGGEAHGGDRRTQAGDLHSRTRRARGAGCGAAPCAGARDAGAGRSRACLASGSPVTDEALPWDVYATPITARKFARLVSRGDGIAFLPAFFQAGSAPYSAVSRAVCELGEPHAAPDADCTCGFYAVGDDDDLWRLGGGDPELVVLDVELSGRVIEHEHGYRASDQRVRGVSIPRRCVRCGREAALLHRRLFGSVVPACPRCARHPLTLDDASAVLGVPVRVE